MNDDGDHDDDYDAKTRITTIMMHRDGHDEVDDDHEDDDAHDDDDNAIPTCNDGLSCF